MSRRARGQDGVVVREEIGDDGRISFYDQTGRPLIDSRRRLRVVALHNFRRWGVEAPPGTLGWTVPGTSSGYDDCVVRWDTGGELRVRTYAVSAVLEGQALALAQRILDENSDTLHSSNFEIALAAERRDHIARYAELIEFEHVQVTGFGPSELYAVTYPSLIELGGLRSSGLFPIKVGYTDDIDAGALGRITGFIGDPAFLFEKPRLLALRRTVNGRKLEAAVHRLLRAAGREFKNGKGRDWVSATELDVLRAIDDAQEPEANPKLAARGCSRAPYVAMQSFLSPGEALATIIDGAATQLGVIKLANFDPIDDIDEDKEAAEVPGG